MSVEFIKGPNVYLRESTANDLTNIKEALVDWDFLPFSLERAKKVLKAGLIDMRYIERPYKDTSDFKETFTVCKNSDNSFVGFMQYRVSPGKLIKMQWNAALPALRNAGLMNEAAKLVDAALFTELSCTSCTDKHDANFITSRRAYQTLEGTELSKRSNRTLNLVKTVKADYDTWRSNNSSSVPTYTFSGGSYTRPQDR